MGLTDKQRRFCEEYLKDFNGTLAYTRAGYAGNSTTARKNASKLLTNTDIQAYLAKFRSQAQKRTEVTIDRTLQEIARVAFCNLKDAADFNSEGVAFKDSKQLPDEVTAAIESVTYTASEKGVRQSIKMHNKIAALSLLAKFFGIDSDFNQAVAVLKRFGLALLVDENSDLGWRLEKHEL